MPRNSRKSRTRSRAETVSPAQRITAEIIKRLEEGTRPWVKPWRGVPSARPLRACGIPYQGINVFWLWLVADMCGFASPYWMTYRQAKELGGQVRKGEKATIAVFYKSYTKEVADPATGEKEDQARRVLKSFPVFNADQVDDLPVRFRPAPPVQPVAPAGQRDELDAFIAKIPAKLRHQGAEAYYEPVADRVTMPPVELFTGYDHYYATLAHELSHWTGHASRLARDLKNRFGTESYAAEELVAELSSAMLGAELGLPVAHLDNHTSYIDHWLQLLKKDDRAILTAAARAEAASSLLLQLGGRKVDGGDAGDASDDDHGHDHCGDDERGDAALAA
ncbi:zincin-like metallopeptidase domain-containing protein [uncultured Croceicoccus sp.]|uniref:ArdC family protein n=1 Tax=uncultured Croceicoccus sp. TaxID=1295329 RepID=UPI00261DFA5D|nr:zincin-like metallopeptidase domain-containing protein [uncultured Croceicoccus sp.]